jgi:hypothetical protein
MNLTINTKAFPDADPGMLQEMLGVLPYWVREYNILGTDMDSIRNEFRETTEINNIIPLAAGDYIEMYVYNGASGSINISGSSDKPFATHFSAFRIGS